VLRTFVIKYGGGFLERELEEQTARLDRLADFATLVHLLIPHQYEAGKAIADMVSGEAEASEAVVR
jgi:hypothetical protein